MSGHGFNSRPQNCGAVPLDFARDQFERGPGDEKESFAELRSFLSGVIRPQIAEFGGNIFKEAAELVLAEFDSVTKAVCCAAALRDEIAHRNEKLPEEQRIVIRIGINFGDSDLTASARG